MNLKVSRFAVNITLIHTIQLSDFGILRNDMKPIYCALKWQYEIYFGTTFSLFIYRWNYHVTFYCRCTYDYKMFQYSRIIGHWPFFDIYIFQTDIRYFSILSIILIDICNNTLMAMFLKFPHFFIFTISLFAIL